MLGNQTCFRLMAYWNIISKIPNNYKVMEGFIKGRRMDEDHSKTNYFNHTRMSNFEIVVVKTGIGYRPNKFLKSGSCLWNKEFEWTLKMDFFFNQKDFFQNNVLPSDWRLSYIQTTLYCQWVAIQHPRKCQHWLKVKLHSSNIMLSTCDNQILKNKSMYREFWVNQLPVLLIGCVIFKWFGSL